MPCHHVFDRLVQFTHSEHKSLVQVSKSGHNLDRIRDVGDTANLEKLRDKSLTTIRQTLRQAKVDSGSGIHVIPDAAAAFKTTATISGTEEDEQALLLPKRKTEIMNWIKTGKGAMLGQRRLDSLLISGSLPAVSPLMSTTVERHCPINIDSKDGKLYISSSWFIRHAQFNNEIQTKLAVVPGMRHSIGDRPIRALPDLPGDFSSRMHSTEHVDTDGDGVNDDDQQQQQQQQPSSIATGVAGEASAASSSSSTGNSGAEKTSHYSASSKSSDNMRQNVDSIIEAKAIDDPVFVAMRNNNLEATDEQADMLLSSTKTMSALFCCFDMNVIYLTLIANEMFVHDHDSYIEGIEQMFPACFNQDDVVLPDMTTQFRTLPHARRQDMVMLLSSVRKKSAPASNEPAPHSSSSSSSPPKSDSYSRARGRVPTSQDLFSVRELHYMKTGEYVEETDIVKMMALYADTYSSSSGAGNVSKPMSRHEWMKDLEKCKIESGVIGEDDEAMLIVADIGLGLLSQGIRHLARVTAMQDDSRDEDGEEDNEEVCDLVASSMIHLRKESTVGSTTALEVERKHVKNNLAIRLRIHDNKFPSETSQNAGAAVNSASQSTTVRQTPSKPLHKRGRASTAAIRVGNGSAQA